jgi:alcohol dehydrogenase, propanol-preferring
MAMLKTMKAAVVEKFGTPLVVREVPVPTPGSGQALVEIIASGVCHTDLHAADGDWPVKPLLHSHRVMKALVLWPRSGPGSHT